MKTYRLRDPKRGVLGPLGYEAVRDLIRTGAVDTEVQISTGDGPFAGMATFNEFRFFTDRRLAGTAGKGDLSQLSFMTLLYRLHRQRANGRLEVERGEEYKVVFLEDGAPAYITSNHPRERFGQFLLGQGLIDQHELRMALETMHVDNNRLAATILRMGLLEGPDLYTALREQQIERLTQLCRWRTGHYIYTTESRHSGDRVQLGIDVHHLLLTAARQFTDGELIERLRPVLDKRLAVRDHSEIRAFHFGPMEQRIVHFMSGSQTGYELVNVLGTDEERRLNVLRALYLLFATDSLSVS